MNLKKLTKEKLILALNSAWKEGTRLRKLNEGLNINHEAKDAIVKDLSAEVAELREQTKGAHFLQIENQILDKKIDELRKIEERQKETIKNLEKRTVQLVNDTFSFHDRIGELERSLSAKKTTIQELCRIVAEGGR